ncbi:TadE/TadG family type IV pilus assembly protein [Virgibacillus salinus]|uniref:Flp pilus assembly protein TadG n=1 Tax=Virgibacillus salinus TaxID=553311 RepID=A0A1H0XYA5_9BACI|nr:TadE/TadG family type IV pilus assembly protein [Virgibacillus salinus]SDQ07860.1 Flp pilus assembly protein TadG [Virgibacillus salinus]
MMKKKCKLLFKEQSGIAMILVALLMFVLIGFSAIVVDAGGLYLEKSRLQKSLDAAVLGGAQVLTTSEANAKAVAIDIAADNGFTVTESEVSTGENFIEIHKTVNKDLTFARVLGFDQTDVAAKARAEIMNTLIGGGGITPVGVELGDEWEFADGSPYVMNFQPGNGENSSVGGNFGFLGIDGNGAQALADAILNGADFEVYDPDDPESYEYVETETGAMVGPVNDAFETLIEQDADKEHCQTYETADNTCSRVVTVPIVEEYTESGSSEVRIVGFAAFWIESVHHFELSGRFIDYVRSGEFSNEGEDYGISGVKLVE